MAERIGDILKKAIKDIKKNKSGEIARFINESVLNAPAQKHVKVFKIQKNRVVLHADSSVWCYHIAMEKEKMEKKIKSAYPEIDTIIIKVGR